MRLFDICGTGETDLCGCSRAANFYRARGNVPTETDLELDATLDAMISAHHADGREKYYVASEHMESQNYRALAPDDLFAIAVKHGLHYDHLTQTGVVFHMIATLAENGRIGAVAISDSPQEADRLFERTTRVLNDEAAAALVPIPLPDHQPPWSMRR